MPNSNYLNVAVILQLECHKQRCLMFDIFTQKVGILPQVLGNLIPKSKSTRKDTANKVYDPFC